MTKATDSTKEKNEIKAMTAKPPSKILKNRLGAIQVSRRVPNRPLTSRTDVYITSSRSEAPLHKRIHKLLFSENLQHVTLHGMGTNCIFKAIKIASDFAENHKPYIKTITTTSTETVVDDCVVRFCVFTRVYKVET